MVHIRILGWRLPLRRCNQYDVSPPRYRRWLFWQLQRILWAIVRLGRNRLPNAGQQSNQRLNTLVDYGGRGCFRNAYPLSQDRRWGYWIRLSPLNVPAWPLDKAAERNTWRVLEYGALDPQHDQPQMEGEMHRLCWKPWLGNRWWQNHRYVAVRCWNLHWFGDQRLDELKGGQRNGPP